MSQIISARRKQLENLQAANSLSDAERRKHLAVIRFLENVHKGLYTAEADSGEEVFAYIKGKYDGDVANMRQMTVKAQQELAALFHFVEEAFGDGNEMLILVTELTVHSDSAQFIATFGSPEYQRHNQELMLGERSSEIKSQITELGL